MHINAVNDRKTDRKSGSNTSSPLKCGSGKRRSHFNEIHTERERVSEWLFLFFTYISSVVCALYAVVYARACSRVHAVKRSPVAIYIASLSDSLASLDVYLSRLTKRWYITFCHMHWNIVHTHDLCCYVTTFNCNQFYVVFVFARPLWSAIDSI